MRSLFLGNDIGDKTAAAGGPGEAYAVCERERSLIEAPDPQRFNWREFWQTSHRLRACFDGRISQDVRWAWRRIDGLSVGPRTAGTRFWREKSPNSDLIAIVGLRFEARILASQSIPAVFPWPDWTSLPRKLAAANRGVISFGICGGLAPGLRAGACIVASCVYDGTRLWRTDEAWSKRLVESIPGAAIAPILGVDAPIVHMAEKRRLHERFGAAVVDMESHLAAAAARARRLPFVAIRVVADDARCDLPDAALAGRCADGSINTSAVLRALLDNPADLAPLIRLAARTRLARAKLLSLSQSLGDRMGLPVADSFAE